MTGYGLEGDRLAAADAGFDACLLKPVDDPEPVKTIDNLEQGRTGPG